MMDHKTISIRLWSNVVGINGERYDFAGFTLCKYIFKKLVKM